MAFEKYNIPTKKPNSTYSRLKQNFILGQPLGEGAFSTVYLAKRVRSGQLVALKQIKIDSLEEEYRELCKNEAALLNKINSKNVVNCYDSFNENDFLYLSLEYSDHGDLEKQIQKMQEKGRLFCERTIWYFFHQICNGLKDMHEKRIIHRDLKPANIFLNSRGQAKIGDLGLSHLLPEDKKITFEPFGTEYYMAPERNGKNGYGFQSDIWSLGCLLYEFVTLQSPFSGDDENVWALHKKINESRYLPISSDLYSNQLRFFIAKCLSINPNNRPSTELVQLAARRMYVLFEEMLVKYKREKAKQKEEL